jgi:hypothetical protein
MITPYQITINTSNLPAIVNTAIISIDNTLATWQIDEGGKIWSINWANQSGWSETKENGLRTLIEAYKSLGWNTTILSSPGDKVIFKVLFNRL